MHVIKQIMYPHQSMWGGGGGARGWNTWLIGYGYKEAVIPACFTSWEV